MITSESGRLRKTPVVDVNRGSRYFATVHTLSKIEKYGKRLRR